MPCAPHMNPSAVRYPLAPQFELAMWWACFWWGTVAHRRHASTLGSAAAMPTSIRSRSFSELF